MCKSFIILGCILAISQLGNVSHAFDNVPASTGNYELSNSHEEPMVNSDENNSNRKRGPVVLLLLSKNSKGNETSLEEETAEDEEQIHHGQKSKRCMALNLLRKARLISIPKDSQKNLLGFAESSINDSVQNLKDGKSYFRLASRKDTNNILKSLLTSRSSKREDNDSIVSKSQNEDPIILVSQDLKKSENHRPKKYICYCIEDNCVTKKPKQSYRPSAMRTTMGRNILGKNSYSTNEESQQISGLISPEQQDLGGPHNLHCPPGAVLVEESDYSEYSDRKHHSHKRRPVKKCPPIITPCEAGAETIAQPMRINIPLAENRKINGRVYKVDRTLPFVQKLQSVIEQHYVPGEIPCNGKGSPLNNVLGVPDHYYNKQKDFDRYAQVPMARNFVHPSPYALYPQQSQYPQSQYQPSRKINKWNYSPDSQYNDKITQIYLQEMEAGKADSKDAEKTVLHSGRYPQSRIPTNPGEYSKNDAPTYNLPPVIESSYNLPRIANANHKTDSSKTKKPTYFDDLGNFLEPNTANPGESEIEEYDDVTEEGREDEVRKIPSVGSVLKFPLLASTSISSLQYPEYATEQTGKDINLSLHDDTSEVDDLTKYYTTGSSERSSGIANQHSIYGSLSFDEKRLESSAKSPDTVFMKMEEPWTNYETTFSTEIKGNRFQGSQKITTVYPVIDDENHTLSPSTRTQSSNNRIDKNAGLPSSNLYYSVQPEQTKTTPTQSTVGTIELTPINNYSKSGFVSSSKSRSDNQYTTSHLAMKNVVYDTTPTNYYSRVPSRNWDYTTQSGKKITSFIDQEASTTDHVAQTQYVGSLRSFADEIRPTSRSDELNKPMSDLGTIHSPTVTEAHQKSTQQPSKLSSEYNLYSSQSESPLFIMNHRKSTQLENLELKLPTIDNNYSHENMPNTYTSAESILRESTTAETDTHKLGINRNGNSPYPGNELHQLDTTPSKYDNKEEKRPLETTLSFENDSDMNEKFKGYFASNTFDDNIEEVTGSDSYYEEMDTNNYNDFNTTSSGHSTVTDNKQIKDINSSTVIDEDVGIANQPKPSNTSSINNSKHYMRYNNGVVEESSEKESTLNDKVSIGTQIYKEDDDVTPMIQTVNGDTPHSDPDKSRLFAVTEDLTSPTFKKVMNSTSKNKESVENPLALDTTASIDKTDLLKLFSGAKSADNSYENYGALNSMDQITVQPHYTEHQTTPVNECTEDIFNDNGTSDEDRSHLTSVVKKVVENLISPESNNAYKNAPNTADTVGTFNQESSSGLPLLKNLFSLPEVKDMVINTVKDFISEAGGVPEGNLLGRFKDQEIESVLNGAINAVLPGKTLSPSMSVEKQQYKNGHWMVVPASLALIKGDVTQNPADEIFNTIQNIIERADIGIQGAKLPTVQNVIVHAVENVLMTAKKVVDHSLIWETLNNIIARAENATKSTLQPLPTLGRLPKIPDKKTPSGSLKSMPIIPVIEHVFKNGQWSEKKTVLGNRRKPSDSKLSPSTTATSNVDSESLTSSSNHEPSMINTNNLKVTTNAVDYALLGESEENEDESSTQDVVELNGDGSIEKVIESVDVTASKENIEHKGDPENAPIKYYSPNDRILTYIKNHQTLEGKTDTNFHSSDTDKGTKYYCPSPDMETNEFSRIESLVESQHATASDSDDVPVAQVETAESGEIGEEITSGDQSTTQTLRHKFTKIPKYYDSSEEETTLTHGLFGAAKSHKKIKKIQEDIKGSPNLVTPKTDPTYFGKLSLNGGNPSEDRISDLINADLFYIGDGVKIPLVIRRMPDGSYALSISEKICEKFINRKCPCCVPNDGNIVQESRQLDVADGVEFEITSKKNSYDSASFEPTESSKYESETKRRYVRSTSGSDIIETKISPVKSFVKKYNVTLNLLKDRIPVQSLTINEKESQDMRNTKRNKRLGSFRDTKIMNLFDNNNQIQRNDSEERMQITDDNSDVVSKESNFIRRSESSYDKDINSFIHNLLHIREAPEHKRTEIVINALDGLINSASTKNLISTDHQSVTKFIDEDSTEDQSQWEDSSVYDLQDVRNKIAEYGYQKGNPIIERIRFIKENQHGHGQYKYQQNMDHHAKGKMNILKTVLHWLREVFLEAKGNNKI